MNFAKINLKEKSKMLFLSAIIGALIGLFTWQYFVENVAALDVKIPQSQNITFNQQIPQAMTTAQVADEFEKIENKPVLLYIYTTWCGVCEKNFPVINEIAREFQNTNLHFVAIAIDRDLDPNFLMQHLSEKGELYFMPKFLAHKEGFKDFLRKQNIPYNNRIPFTALISANGEVVTSYSGFKNKNYLRNKIIKELYL